MWWIPLLVGLGAAVASYCATWRFKRADVNRDSASRVADLVYQAEQLMARTESYTEAGGTREVTRLLRAARINAQPLADLDLDDRLRAAAQFGGEVLEWQQETGRAQHWLAQAVANARVALVPHLAAPKLIPRPSLAVDRWFPTSDELLAMSNKDRAGNDLLDALIDWRARRDDGAA